MKKKEKHIKELTSLFYELIERGINKNLIEYLLKNSNLPGRRANLELAEAFSDLINQLKNENGDKLNLFLTKLLNYSVDMAPTNTPWEFIPFCGTWALGAMGTSKKYYNTVLLNLKNMASDSRWRIREAVAKALKILINYDYKMVLDDLKSWIKREDDWLLMRAVAAGLAEADINNEIFTNQALEYHIKIFNNILNCDDRTSENFKSLKKGLGFTLSVIVHKKPKNGFKLIKELIQTGDNDILWIIKNNLRKNRLIKNYPEEVKQLNKLLK